MVEETEEGDELTWGGDEGERRDDMDDGDGDGAAVARDGRGDPPRGEATPAAARSHGDSDGRAPGAGGHELGLEGRAWRREGGGRRADPF